MNGGYVIVDFNGFDLGDTNRTLPTETVKQLKEAKKNAINGGKLVVFTNFHIGFSDIYYSFMPTCIYYNKAADTDNLINWYNPDGAVKTINLNTGHITR